MPPAFGIISDNSRKENEQQMIKINAMNKAMKKAPPPVPVPFSNETKLDCAATEPIATAKREGKPSTLFNGPEEGVLVLLLMAVFINPNYTKHESNFVIRNETIADTTNG
jgi:hypothetical protein